MKVMVNNLKKRKSISYAKWGYVFVAPFIVTYAIFQLWPLITTVYYSFFRRFKDGVNWIDGGFVGLDNYVNFITGNVGEPMLKLFGNTLIMWIMGFIPQIIVSLLFAYWFTNKRLNLKCTSVFKSIIYMPNLIMASAFALLMFSFFSSSEYSVANNILLGLGIIDTKIDFLADVWIARGVIAFMNFIMWFGNTTILLMSAMLGVDESLVEAADIDGCTPAQIFWKITIPLIRPIMVYVLITSLVGGLQMFDVPQVLTGADGGGTNGTCRTLIMFLNDNMFSFNYGAGGAISVVLFIICGVLSMLVYYFFTDRELKGAKSYAKKKAKKGRA